MRLFDRFKKGLAKTRERLVGGLRRVLPFGAKIDDDLLDRLEETMIEADFGPTTATKLIDEVREAWKRRDVDSADQILPLLREKISAYWPVDDRQLTFAAEGPTVILVAGVNGSGKTTSIAKLAKRLKDDGRKVMVAACDTFRAAAVEQLTIWSERTGVAIVKQETGSDPGAVAYDACEAAVARGIDVVLVDTAGRLHTQQHLMRELEKIHRVVSKKISGAPHEVLLVLDATTGQNAVVQAREFRATVDVTGIVLAKLDGSAKGGVVVGIRDQIDIPVKFVGVGETLDDLEPFEPTDFVDALLAED
jgi:fused signal recognition particle receptor